jgi:solute carrier family 13 (sodium-dependent dicarboxylate transporter), member 2/3/5
MPPEAWIVLLVLVVLFGALIRGISSPPALLLGALVAVVVLGVLPPERAFGGFSSPATITIAGLFVVARAVRDHLPLDRLLDDLLELDGHDLRPVLLRLLPPVTLLSGVLNNTPIVATTAPVVRGWARRRGVPSSKLLIPLSFATIFGGILTTIGTSTNLVVSGALEAAGHEPFGFFAVTPLGAPLAVVGLVLLVALAPRMLPVRPDPGEPGAHGPLGATGGAATRSTVERPPGRGELADHPTTVATVAGSEHPGRSRLAARGSGPRIVTLVAATAMVAAAASGLLPMVTAVLLACGVLVVTGTVRFRRAMASLDLDVLMLVATAIGLGVAVQTSGLAEVLGSGIAGLASAHGVVVGLALVVVGTLVLTELITNVAAAALLVPVALDVAARVGGDPRGFAVAVAVAASASFLTPIGYQTNTIVYGLGGYRFGDYWRLGLPLAGAVLATTVVVVPLVWS